MTNADARRRLAEMVGDLTTAKMPPAMIVDHLVWAYCPLAANDPRLSDTEKTDLLRRFASQVAALAYTGPGGGEIDVLVNLPLAPAILGRVDDAAKAAGISQDEWLENAIDHSLNNPSGSPAK
ncbi:glutelin [Mesorhizobium soli]|uniref:Glutelin n=2 Tax=Pseudaminobacter soli (ex Li et al. 2025) TaxID=1295366 RepID=A0A2P7SD72_9HYPH|nr:glutelin [Mesorhizobium soli]